MDLKKLLKFMVKNLKPINVSIPGDVSSFFFAALTILNQNSKKKLKT